VINDVIFKLNKTSFNLKMENRQIIFSIISELKANTSNNFWENFTYSFSRVHKNFYKNLESCHPNLSPSEKRLCSFLRLNLNTKDIAYLTHNTVGSIETARIRLRKKLGLSHQNTSLNNYISQF